MLAGILAWPASAAADARAEARAAFQRAVAAEKRQDWRDAIVEYEEAYRLAPHPDVLYNIAGVYERLGERRTAADHYRQYLEEKPGADDRARVERKLVELRGKPSRLTITTAPAGAIVTIDGERRGAAPIDLTVAAGNHELVAEHGGARATRTVSLEYGEPLAVTLPIVTAQGVLVVTSNVAGATVRIDGRDAGYVPWTGPLPAGTHQITVSAAGYTTVERTVDVPADGTATVNGSMGRPLGYVEPTTSKGRMGLFGFDAGTYAEVGGVHGAVFYGYRTPGRHGDGLLGAQFGTKGVGLALKGRFYFTTGAVRPYVGVALNVVSLAQTMHAVGGVALADIGAGLVQVDVFVEAGAGSGSIDSEQVAYFPILAGMIMHLPGS